MASKAEYYIANRARILARVKARAVAKREEVRLYKQAWHANNRAKNADKKRKNYLANREVMLAKMKERYASNPEPRKRMSREYWASNKAAASARSKAWRQKHAQSLSVLKSEWLRVDRRKHPEKYAERTARHRARKRMVSVGRISYRKILAAANGLCCICHKPFDLFGIDFDHIVPLAKGGAHVQDNLQATHSRCNRAKGARVA